MSEDVGRQQLAVLAIKVLDRMCEFDRSDCPEMEMWWSVITQTVWDYCCFTCDTVEHKQAVIAIRLDYLEPYCDIVGIEYGSLLRVVESLERKLKG